MKQSDTCDCMGYNRDKAARNALLWQMDDAELRKLIIAMYWTLEQLCKMGIDKEQADRGDGTAFDWVTTTDSHCRAQEGAYGC